MTDDDFVYGCRSAIQKAIRRGDLDLAHTAFLTLWRDKKQRNWLKWRMPSLVHEEAWQFAGELWGLSNAKFDSAEEEKREYQRLVYKLTVATKSKDATALWFLNNHYKKREPFKHSEYADMTYWRAAFEKAGSNPGVTASELYKLLAKGKSVSDDTLAAMKMMRRRAGMGGMLGDRCICLSGMILAASRGVDTELVQLDVRKKLSEWRNRIGRKRPRLVELPWYAFDMHTQAGKIAVGIFVRNKLKGYSGLSEEKFRSVFFWAESSLVPDYLLANVSPECDGTPSCLESKWYDALLERKLSYGRKKRKAVQKLWNTSMRGDIKGCVEWILEKRGEK